MSVILKDVYKLINSKQQSVALFVPTGEWLDNFDDLAQALGQAIIDERNITTEQAMLLPEDTVLGEKSRIAFSELMTFCQGAFSKAV